MSVVYRSQTDIFILPVDSLHTLSSSTIYPLTLSHPLYSSPLPAACSSVCCPMLRGVSHGSAPYFPAPAVLFMSSAGKIEGDGYFGVGGTSFFLATHTMRYLAIFLASVAFKLNVIRNATQQRKVEAIILFFWQPRLLGCLNEGEDSLFAAAPAAAADIFSPLGQNTPNSEQGVWYQEPALNFSSFLRDRFISSSHTAHSRGFDLLCFCLYYRGTSVGFLKFAHKGTPLKNRCKHTVSTFCVDSSTFWTRS